MGNDLRFLRVFKIPSHAAAWYADRVRRIQRRELTRWAMAELICMSLSLATVSLIVVLGVIRTAGYSSPSWLQDYLLPILMAGAVGYVTNLIAVTMLFRPFGPDDRHPVGAIPGWSQGLIPRNKSELAELAG